MRREIWVIEHRYGKDWEPSCDHVDGFIHKLDAMAALQRWRDSNKRVAGLLGAHKYRIRAYRPRTKTKRVI